jgi:hypothetical protein
MLTDDEFRARLRDVLARSGLSMRALSASMARDPGVRRCTPRSLPAVAGAPDAGRSPPRIGRDRDPVRRAATPA